MQSSISAWSDEMKENDSINFTLIYLYYTLKQTWKLNPINRIISSDKIFDVLSKMFTRKKFNACEV